MSELSLNIGADLDEDGSIVKPTDFFEPDSIEEGLLPEMNQDTDFVAMEALTAQIGELESLRTRIARQGGMNRAFAMEALSIDEEVLDTPVNYYSENDSLVQYDQTMENLGGAIADKTKQFAAHAKEVIKRLIEGFKKMMATFKQSGAEKIEKIRSFVAGGSGMPRNPELVAKFEEIIASQPVLVHQLVRGTYVSNLTKLQPIVTQAISSITVNLDFLENGPDQEPPGLDSAIEHLNEGVSSLVEFLSNHDKGVEVKQGAVALEKLLTSKQEVTNLINAYEGLSQLDVDGFKEPDAGLMSDWKIKMATATREGLLITSRFLNTIRIHLDLFTNCLTYAVQARDQEQVTQEAYGAPLTMTSMESFDAEEGLEVAQAQVDASQGVDAFNMGLGDQLDELQAMREEAAIVPVADADQVLDDEGNPIDEEAYLLNTDNDIPEIDDVSMEADNEPVSKKGGLAAFANKAKNSAVEGMKRLIEMIKNFIAKVQERFRKVTEPRAKKVKEMAKSLAQARGNARLQPVAKKFAELGNNNPVILQAFYDNGLVDAAHQQADQINQWFTQLSRDQSKTPDPQEVIKPVFVEQQDDAQELKPADPAKMAEFVFDLISSDDTTMKVLQLVAKVNNLNDDVLPKLVQALERDHGEGASSMIAYAMKQVRTLTQNVDRLTNSIYDASNTATQALKGNDDEQTGGNVSQEALDLKGMGQSIKQGAGNAARHLAAMIKAMLEKIRALFNAKTKSQAQKAEEKAKELAAKRQELKESITNPQNSELIVRLAAIGNNTPLIQHMYHNRDLLAKLQVETYKLGEHFAKVIGHMKKAEKAHVLDIVMSTVDAGIFMPSISEADTEFNETDIPEPEMAQFITEIATDSTVAKEAKALFDKVNTMSEGVIADLQAQLDRFELNLKANPIKPALMAFSKLSKQVAWLLDSYTKIQDQLEGVVGKTKDQIAAENQTGDYSQESYLATYTQEGFGEKFRAGGRRILEMIKVLLAKLKKLWKAFSSRVIAGTMSGLMKSKLLIDNDWSRSAVLYMQDKGVFEELVQMVNSKPYLVAISNDLSIINRVLIPSTEAQIRMASNLNREIKALNKSLSNLSRNADEEFAEGSILGMAKVTSTNVGLSRAMDEYKALFNSTLDTPEQSVDGLVKALDAIKKAVTDKRYLATYLNSLDKLRDELASLPDIITPSNLDESHPAMASIGDAITAIQKSLQEIEESLRMGYTTVHTGVEMIKRLNEALEVKEKIDLEVGATA